MHLLLSPVTHFDQFDIASDILELAALAEGEASMDDLAIDMDALADVLMDEPAKYGYEADSRTLRNEEAHAKMIAKETIYQLIREEIKNRSEEYSAIYPFKLARSGMSIRTHWRPDTTLCAIGMQFLRLFNLQKNDEIASWETDKEKEQFRKQAEKLFEIFAVLALYSKVEGLVIWTGKSRGYEKALKLMLDDICEAMGYGSAKTVSQLTAEQLSVNDGGIDGCAISTDDGEPKPDAEIFVLGATIQANSRDKKIIGSEARGRIATFFLQRPRGAMRSIHAIPFPSEDAEQDRCARVECEYWPLDRLLKRLNAVGANRRHRRFRERRHELRGEILTVLRDTLNALHLTGGPLDCVKLPSL